MINYNYNIMNIRMKIDDKTDLIDEIEYIKNYISDEMVSYTNTDNSFSIFCDRIRWDYNKYTFEGYLEMYYYTLSCKELIKFRDSFIRTYPTINFTSHLQYYRIKNIKYLYDDLYQYLYNDLYDNNSLYFNVLPREIFKLITKEVNNDILGIIDITTLFIYNKNIIIRYICQIIIHSPMNIEYNVIVCNFLVHCLQIQECQ